MIMKITLYSVVSFLSILVAAAAARAETGEYLLEEIKITGNHVTKESYVRSFVTLREGALYSLDELLEGINASKEKLEGTGLFSGVTVDDQTREGGRLSLTVRVSERGYFRAAPSGYINLPGKEDESESGVALSYDNLFGTGATLAFDIPLYDVVGLGFEARSRPDRFAYGVSALYAHDISEDRSWYYFAPFASLPAGKALVVGLEAKLNRDDFSSVVFTPSVERGTRERPSGKTKKWRHAGFSPYAGANFPDDSGSADGNALWGINADVCFYRDLLLGIVIANSFEVGLQGGAVPENLRQESPVRGNRYRTLEADVVISTANELRVPLPWDNDVVLVPFVDAAFMGDRSLTLYLGGGIGLRWYKGFLDPLLIDLGFGRGVTLNFEKRL
jgi:hypothetical protein